MRHRRRVKHFSRGSNPRKALIRGLIVSLVEHGRIKTTVAKAKELRRHVEKAITIAKNNDLSSRRLLISRLASKDAVSNLFANIAPRFKERAGGYTRIIKIGQRPGDSSEMAFIEFVDYDFKSKLKTDAAPATDKKAKSTDKKAASKKDSKEVAALQKAEKTAKREAARNVLRHKKNIRKIQTASRRYNRD